MLEKWTKNLVGQCFLSDLLSLRNTCFRDLSSNPWSSLEAMEQDGRSSSIF